MRLHTAGVAEGFRKPIIARISKDPVSIAERPKTALVLESFDLAEGDLRGYAALISKADIGNRKVRIPVVHKVRDTDHLRPGHVVVLESQNGFIRTIYRPESGHNTLFATERCNSNCLMCSQPPKDVDDTAGLTERNLQLIDFLQPAPEYLCITGGEPTLLGDNLLKIVTKLRDTLPETYVHMLTNGRRFAWAEFTAQFASIRHPSFSVGIPLYSDDAAQHDHVVQARGAFEQTVLGLHQLARYDIETEIRVVLHALTIPRLTHLAEYICRNLTFVDHVAFMGLEHIGYAPRNMDKLWIDPVDYQAELEESVATLKRFGIETRIYNLQLCVLKQGLWKYAAQSISDWKNEYVDICDKCAVRERCAGFFHWATNRRSRGIHAVTARHEISIEASQ
jgi:His-Xaa-Ser system radical SAM maturase HxsC